MKTKKIAIVVHQYGDEICGGAEYHASILADHMTPYFDVSILTVENKKGERTQEKNKIHVKRFPVRNSFFRYVLKSKSFFASILRPLLKIGFILVKKKADYKVLKRSLYTPSLLKYIKNNQHEYAVFIFFSYLYYASYYGMKLVKNKAVFIPLAHDEPIFYKTPSTLFSTPALTMFNSTSEMKLVKERVDIPDARTAIIGCGVNEEVVFNSSFTYPNPYLIFLGRIEKMKGGGLLIDYFMKFSQKHKHYGLKLLLLGNKKMEIPKHDDIVYLGFKSESEKFQYLNNALALVNPSFLESLSLIVLESFYVETPVIVNGACEVLVDHVNKSDAGFVFNSFEEFETAVIQLLVNKEIRKKMSEKGKEYYNNNYRWSVIEEKTVSSINALIAKGESNAYP